MRAGMLCQRNAFPCYYLTVVSLFGCFLVTHVAAAVLGASTHDHSSHRGKRVSRSESDASDGTWIVDGSGIGFGIRGDVLKRGHRRVTHSNAHSLMEVSKDDKPQKDKPLKSEIPLKRDTPLEDTEEMIAMELQTGMHGVCVTHAKGKREDASGVETRTCSMRKEQRFYFDGKRLKSKFDHKCVTLGRKFIQLMDCHKYSEEQLWEFKDSQIRSLSRYALGQCIELGEPDQPAKPLTSARPLLGKTCHSGITQKFRFKISAPRATLLTEGVRCEMGIEFLGKTKTVEECMRKVKKQGSWYFNYGNAAPDTGKCYTVGKLLNLEDSNCAPMFKTSTYDFWMLEPGAEATLLAKTTSCRASETDVGLFDSLEECLEAVRVQGGKYFIYGKDNEAKRCFKKNAVSKECPEGWIQNASYNFYEVNSFEHLIGMEAELVKSDVRCNSGDQAFGKRETPLVCMQTLIKESSTIQAKGMTFFAYGKGVNDEECIEELTSTEDCTEGWFPNRNYDFFAAKLAEAELMKTNSRCKAQQETLGYFHSIEQCLAEAKRQGARFFSFGKFLKPKECFRVYTASSSCPEGFVPDLYDLYRVVSYEKPCPMPEGVVNASTYTCLEGTHIKHGEQCTPSCLRGYKANLDKMVCFDGQLKPKVYVCLEENLAEAETSLSESTLIDTGEGAAAERQSQQLRHGVLLQAEGENHLRPRLSHRDVDGKWKGLARAPLSDDEETSMKEHDTAEDTEGMVGNENSDAASRMEGEKRVPEVSASKRNRKSKRLLRREANHGQPHSRQHHSRLPSKEKVQMKKSHRSHRGHASRHRKGGESSKAEG